MNNAVLETNFSTLNLVKRGKVRDIYDLGDCFLMIATDRLSAFDVIMPDPIPDKGKVLTQISLFWFDQIKPIIDNHIITSNIENYPDNCQPYANFLKDRSILVKKAKPLEIECVVRGYISGSGWKSYKSSNTICGIKLPSGLKESDKLPEPIFTPSTKAEIGEHDINIDFNEAANIIGKKTAQKIKDLSLLIYSKGVELSDKLGIIIADTKFEFGIVDDNIILIDEVLTPDSSRFWNKNKYNPGGAQDSFDKQYIRDYLESIGWDKKSPGPSFPKEVIYNTRKKYIEALELLTGKKYDF